MTQVEPTSIGVTRLLREWGDGRREALDELFPLLYQELRRLAARHLRHEHQRRSISPTALVNEVYVKLVHQHGIRTETRDQFLGVVARTMRALLVDRARARNAAKRRRPGGADAAPAIDGIARPSDLDLVILDEALTRLAVHNARQAHVVELRFFVGLTVEEIADALQISPATVTREWTHARAWLYAELKRPAL